MTCGAKTPAARFAVAAFLLLAALPARAQADQWVVIPATTDTDLTRLDPSLQELTDELTRAGVSVPPASDTAARFEARGSESARAPTEAELEAWADLSRRGLGHLARLEYAAALEELKSANVLSRSAAVELNRNESTAGVLLDTCLYTVRALLGLGKRATARAQAEECARLAPGAEVNANMHPPDVRAFYEDAVDAGLSGTGSLAIASAPPGCEAWVNGRLAGRTPARFDRLPSGAYGVQVECDERVGRVHRVIVGRGTIELRVDTRFDQALHTDGRLWMRYAAWPSPEQLASDAQSIASTLSPDAVVLVTAPTEATMEIRLVDGAGSPRGFARLPTPDQNGERPRLAWAVEKLIAGECSEWSDGEARPVDCASGKPVTSDDTAQSTELRRPPRGQFISGVTLASVGTASLVTAYALYGVRSGSADDDMIQSPTNENQARWLNLRAGMFYTGSVGAAALVTAMPLALPYRNRTPWWAWFSGATGIALAATSIALAITAPPQPELSRVADPDGYVARGKRTDAAFLVGVTAAPLLTMPLVYLLRREGKRGPTGMTPRIMVSRSGGTIGLAGAF
jgi:hypothetical protein